LGVKRIWGLSKEKPAEYKCSVGRFTLSIGILKRVTSFHIIILIFVMYITFLHRKQFVGLLYC